MKEHHSSEAPEQSAQNIVQMAVLPGFEPQPASNALTVRLRQRHARLSAVLNRPCINKHVSTLVAKSEVTYNVIL